MTFADPVAVIREIVEKLGHTTAEILPTDFVDHLPIVHVYLISGSEDYIDRTDKIGIDVYAQAPLVGQEVQAKTIAAQVNAALAAAPLYTAAGTIDETLVDQVPVSRPFVDDIDVSSMSVLVTHRHID